jgi:hypothetical protein
MLCITSSPFLACTFSSAHLSIAFVCSLDISISDAMISPRFWPYFAKAAQGKAGKIKQKKY